MQTFKIGNKSEIFSIPVFKFSFKNKCFNTGLNIHWTFIHNNVKLSYCTLNHPSDFIALEKWDKQGTLLVYVNSKKYFLSQKKLSITLPKNILEESKKKADKESFLRNYFLKYAILKKVIGEDDYHPMIFRKKEYGKPELLYSNLEFNVTHSGNHLLLALSYMYEVGVDLEVERNLNPMLDRSSYVFSSIEKWYFYKKKKQGSFFQTWVIKEATVKAIGQGLSFPLSLISYNPDKKKIFIEKSSHFEVQNLICACLFKVFPFLPGCLVIKKKE